jgi:hypothetical protein
MSSEGPISERYRPSLRMAVVLPSIIFVLSVLMLDGGETARLSGIGLFVFWAWVLVAIWQRPGNPTAVDLMLIRWGCPPLVVGFQVAIHCAWHWRGWQ